jgi:DNA-directed RNA polymerase subunit RPC12/RpoP
MMPKTIENKRVQSQPTMCLQCHLVVSMFHENEHDTQDGAWECPNCSHKYPFAHWKIKKQTRSRNRAA